MKSYSFIILMVLCLSLVSAAITVEAPDTIPLVIVGSTNETAFYDLTITNTGPADEFQLYSLVGVSLEPSRVRLESGIPTKLTLRATPGDKLLDNTRGFVRFEYEIFNTLSGTSKHELMMKIIDLGDAFFIRPVSVEPGDTTAIVTLQNLENTRFNNLRIKVDSPLFEDEQTVSLNPYEIVNITVPINTEAARKLVAGTYSLRVEFHYAGAEDRIIPDLKYLEKGGIAVSESFEGVVVRTKITEKTNEGNVPVTVTISERRDIFTRLVTDYDPTPDTVSKRGFYVIYGWQKHLAPSESLHVTATTNYTLPLIFLALIVLAVVIVKIYIRRSLSLVKRVSFVRTRGGEFALKVTIHAKAHRALANVHITDHIPHSMKLYESYGIKPDAVHEATRSVSWHLAHLNAGEERVFSYIMYSKIRVVGSFELPAAHATYTHNGAHVSVLSNKTSFASEISQKE